MMTGEQKQQIIVLRRDGAGYGRIAARLQISINTVKSFCRRHGLVAKSADSVCEQCGKPIEQNPGLSRIRGGSGKGSAAMPVGISGGMHIWSW